MLYTLANDAFAQIDKSLVKLQQVGFFIDGLYHDFLPIKLMKENPKSFQVAVQSALAEKT